MKFHKLDILAEVSKKCTGEEFEYCKILILQLSDSSRFKAIKQYKHVNNCNIIEAKEKIDIIAWKTGLTLKLRWSIPWHIQQLYPEAKKLAGT